MLYISIILSAYNHEASVQQCLESIIDQENADMQLECIIVDDCSTDNTLNVIRRLVGGYKGNIIFRIFRRQTHYGLARSRNTGLQRAQGYFVLFLNGVDRLRAGCIDTYMVSLMRHWDADVIAGNVYHVSLGRNLFNNISNALVLRGKGDVMCHEMIRNNMFLYCNNKLIRRDVLINSNITFNEGVSYPDIQWCFSLFKNLSSVVLLPDVTYEYSLRQLGAINHAMKWVNALLASYTATCETLLDHTPRPESSDGGYYQAHQLFVYGMLVHSQSLIEEYNVSNQVKRELGNIRSRLIDQTKNDGQKMLYLYFRQDSSIITSIFKPSVFNHFRKSVEGVTYVLNVLVGR